jgi:UDP-N-acetyl-D-mannosaminuronate dehydrogenase
MKIAIVGLGYVGLPLSLQFDRAGVLVPDLDIGPVKFSEPVGGVPARFYRAYAP